MSYDRLLDLVVGHTKYENKGKVLNILLNKISAYIEESLYSQLATKF